ncbi:PilN domain-containing protein [Psychrobacter sp. HD31]|uniref:PilN domain-containing protein n=1 Tax=Psychrobacter sp. HD31 TaxID=3112003 RepID=UPI003DA53E4D
MVKINLLPWRAQQKQQNNQRFLKQLVLTALLALLLGLGIWQFFNQQLIQQQAANQYILIQTQALDSQLGSVAKIKNVKQVMSQRIQVIDALQTRRTQIVTLWEDVAKSVPTGVYLTRLNQDGDILTFTGMVARKNASNDLAIFVKRLKTSPVIDTAIVKNIQQSNTGTKFNRFEVVAQQRDGIEVDDEQSMDVGEQP